jgi:predicted kinase
VYEFKKPDVTPGPTNTTPGGGLVFRSAPSPAAVRVVLVCGPPGSGKSTWAKERQEGRGLVSAVIDRDQFVLTEDGYNPDGRAESLAALTEAVQAAAPGSRVLFVACMLTPAARRRVADHVTATAGRAVAIEVVAIDRPREVLHAVNAEREGTDRGAIPADQLEHILDAWQAPTPDELNALAGADV